MKKINLLCLLGLFSLMALAQVPAGYYSVAEDKQGDALRLALQDAIDNHTVVSYDALRYLYEYSDTENAAGSTIIDIYSTCGFPYTTSFCAGGCGGGFNREHSVPKSWFNDATPMYSDAFHLYPTSCYVNSYRGNDPLGESATGTKCTTNSMTQALGRRGNSSFAGYSGVVFEPDDEYKGDLARTYFYMATRYADKCATWSGGMFGSAYSGFTTYGRDVLLKWHRQDPVSTKEKIRNEAIYGNSTYNKGSYKQNNRNPFIDYPCLAEYIWGDSTTKSVDFSKLVSSYDASFTGQGCPCELTTDPTLLSPSTSTLSFTAVPSGTNTQAITVKGINLTQTINLALSGTNDALFGLSATSATSAEGLAGKSITITYSPTTEGSHTATLTISSSEFTSAVVTLNGTCSNSIVAPTITSPTYSEGSAGGNITSFGGAASLTENGIYYSTTTGFADGAGTKMAATTAPTTGTFSVDVSTLPVGTYYFKAFATNSAGTGYSSQGTFTITGPEQAPSTTPLVLMGTSVTNALTCTGTKTLLLRISNLATSVNLISSDTGVVTVSPATISPEDAAAGVTLTVTKVNNGTANITISGGVVNQTLNVTCQ